jgi:dTDP-glucose 4,6-dehydratase
MAESDRTVAQRTDRSGFLSTHAAPMGETIHDPVNIGNPRELTVMDIAHLVIKLTGSSSIVQHNPLPVDDPKVRRPDIRRATTLLNWEPQVTLEEGLKKTVQYFQSILSKDTVARVPHAVI